MTGMCHIPFRGRRRPAAKTAPTPEETKTLVEDMRRASAGLDGASDRLCDLVDRVLPEILEGGRNDGTGRRPAQRGGGAAPGDSTP